MYFFILHVQVSYTCRSFTRIGRRVVSHGESILFNSVQPVPTFRKEPSAKHSVVTWCRTALLELCRVGALRKALGGRLFVEGVGSYQRLWERQYHAWFHCIPCNLLKRLKQMPPPCLWPHGGTKKQQPQRLSKRIKKNV